MQESIDKYSVSYLSVTAFFRPLFQRHYHPTVQKFASHLIAGAPTEGSGALSLDLSQR